MRKKSLQIKNIATCIQMIHADEFVSGVLSEEAISRIKNKDFIDIVDYGIYYPSYNLLTSFCVLCYPLWNEEWFVKSIVNNP